MIREAGILITDQEAENIEIVDFGLSNLRTEGVQVFTFFGTKRIAAKVLVLFANQTEPEHWSNTVPSRSFKCFSKVFLCGRSLSDARYNRSS